MNVVNVHHRLLHASPARVSELLASLGSPEDRLWPRNGWPRMRLDGPVAPGAAGGHGPIRYRVEAWQPGRLVRFRFAGLMVRQVVVRDRRECGLILKRVDDES